MNKKIYISIGIFAVIILGALSLLRLSNGGEDTWLCENGVWQKHGNPSSSMPKRGCEKQQAPARPGEFSTGQKYALYEEKDFSVKYPDWPKVDPAKNPEPDKNKLVVSSGGCVFLVRVTSLASGETFASRAKKILEENTKTQKTTVIEKEIGEKKAHFMAENKQGALVVRSDSYSFLTGENNAVGFAFVAVSDRYDAVCSPLIPEVLASMTVK